MWKRAEISSHTKPNSRKCVTRRRIRFYSQSPWASGWKPYPRRYKMVRLEDEVFPWTARGIQGLVNTNTCSKFSKVLHKVSPKRWNAWISYLDRSWLPRSSNTTSSKWRGKEGCRARRKATKIGFLQSKICSTSYTTSLMGIQNPWTFEDLAWECPAL